MKITAGVLSGGGRHSVNFYGVICPENLFRAWGKFSKGKRNNADVAVFDLHLEGNLFSLYERLARGVWRNGPYQRRRIADPKPRIIHIASVRDRILYQAVYQQLYRIFDKTFIHDSYASRESKGTHAGVRRLAVFARKVSANYTRPAFVLKCDIRKFFDGIDHHLLLFLLAKKIADPMLLGLLGEIIRSFHTLPGKGLPLGNVTSQIFANIYLNELDQFVKHALKARYYIRYCDDFVIVNQSRVVLEELTQKIRDFLYENLRLLLHPDKVTIRKLSQGMDFLGYVSLPYYSVLRTRTKRRLLRRLTLLARNIKTKEDFLSAFPVISSYLGMLSHCKGYRLRKRIKTLFRQEFLDSCFTKCDDGG